VIQSGGVVVFPTDTVYGIGCNAFSHEGIEKIYKLKGRSYTKPLPVLLAHVHQLPLVARDVVPETAPLIDEYWPGALTLVLKTSSFAMHVSRGKSTIAVRVPDHRLVRELLNATSVPLATTSANKSGHESIFKADEVKKTLFALRHIQDVALIREQEAGNGELGMKRVRIEAYDVAHLAGESAVGVMTVIENGVAEKNSYRKFRLREEYAGDDLRALGEILRRRLSHPEWALPDILAVDGALLQYGVAERILAERGLIIPIVGIVKNDRHKPDHIIGDAGIVQRYTKEILLANAEAHRFAIAYHRKRRNKDFLPK
jgi:tRNA threonylcarbamoyl adenosine modification protein (Sua5/YciO/YrdC/YwlC family)